jgi:hypothetical protein
MMPPQAPAQKFRELQLSTGGHAYNYLVLPGRRDIAHADVDKNERLTLDGRASAGDRDLTESHMVMYLFGNL